MTYALPIRSGATVIIYFPFSERGEVTPPTPKPILQMVAG
jgi:hypothetical protein